MFGFSLTKIIFTIVAIVAAWKAFQYFTRQNAHQAAPQAAPQSGGRKDRGDQNAASGGVEDMVKCSVCGTYTARGAKSCGQTGCPFRG